MPSQIAVTSTTGSKLRATLQEVVNSVQPGVVGVVSAFLSRPGAKILAEMIASTSGASTRSVIGVSGAVTDPNAIVDLLDQGIHVRLADHPRGIFHPKLLIAGKRFLRSGEVSGPSCGYLGSANFTAGGFARNVEVGIVTTDVHICKELAETFGNLWKLGEEATESRIEDYRARFSARQQTRAIDDLSFLGVAQNDSPAPTIPTAYAKAAWAGLESFTGEYTLQVEFPKRAGDALAVLLGTTDGAVEIDCSDNVKRQMRYRYYADNGMYRLNVPNDMPGAHWARTNHSGALLISRDEDSGALTLEIISGNRLKEVVDRSRMLGYFGHTRTRQYGWY